MIILLLHCCFPLPCLVLNTQQNQQGTQDAVKSTSCRVVQCSAGQTKGCFWKTSALCHGNSAESSLPGAKHHCLGLQGENTGPSWEPLHESGWELHSVSVISAAFSSPPQWHSHSEGHHEKIPSYFGKKKRKRLSCGGKDSYYLLFKSGVTSGRRSMRKGNFQVERIWTLEIFVQKWCLLVSYTLHAQIHPAMPGRLQKEPFTVAEQREARGLGGA